MTRSLMIALVGTLVAVTMVAALELRSRTHVVNAGFWFDDTITFALHDPRRLGGPLTDAEQARVRTLARDEVALAFADFRLRLTERRDAFYRVHVQQELRFRNRYALSGQSNVFGPLGGYGAVGFLTLAAQAMSYAPPGASRAEIVDAIGRGIGRAAVHEFAHQILPSVPLHATRDARSYEYWSSDRQEHYYGPMRWSVALPSLSERLARPLALER